MPNHQSLLVLDGREGRPHHNLLDEAARSVKVLVFDIDGTLTETNQVDGAYFKTAVRDVFPGYELGSFRQFTEFTDTAILRTICEELGEADYASVEAEVQRRFLTGLRAAVVARPEAFAAVAGAREIFDEVRRSGWVPAVATGGWRASAELKLATAGIPTRGVPLATSSERVRRVDIIRLAVSEASKGASVADVVYVGDGPWDVQACREMGIGFLGRAPAGSAGRLCREGSRAVVEDFRAPARVVELIAASDALRPLSE